MGKETVLALLLREKGHFVSGEAVSADAYYYKAALWAFEKKMIDETFAPNTACTRAQAVYFMWMAAGAPTDAAAAAFTDVAADASYAAAVNWAVAQGVTTGRTETTFAPAETCTRGNIVTFLYLSLIHISEPTRPY